MVGYTTYKDEVIRLVSGPYQVGVQRDEAGVYVSCVDFPTEAQAQAFIDCGKAGNAYLVDIEWRQRGAIGVFETSRQTWYGDTPEQAQQAALRAFLARKDVEVRFVMCRARA